MIEVKILAYGSEEISIALEALRRMAECRAREEEREEKARLTAHQSASQTCPAPEPAYRVDGSTVLAGESDFVPSGAACAPPVDVPLEADVLALAQMYVKTNGLAAAQKLLEKYKAKRVPDVPPESRPAFVAELQQGVAA